ncbi:MAG TPA: hypothetical protein VJI73_03040 [Candidatus Paceibacterota bacterium]
MDLLTCMQISLKGIKFFFRKHWIPLFFSILVGLISYAPIFLAWEAIGSDYKGVAFTYQANEDVYMARIHEVTEGYYDAKSPIFYEYKNAFNPLYPSGEYLYALPAIIFGLNVSTIVLLAKFIFPAILFLLIYFFCLRLLTDGNKESNNSEVKLYATSIGLLITLGYDIVDWRYALTLLSGQAQELQLLLWTRPVNPISGALFLSVFLLCLWKLHKSEEYNLGAVIMAGLCLGFSISYFFTFTICGAILAMLFLFNVLKKNYRVLKGYIVLGVIALVVQLPYWLDTLNAKRMGILEKISLQSGLFLQHTSIINKFLLFGTIIFIICSVFLNKTKVRSLFTEKWWQFCAILLAGSWLAFNQQIITGRTVWPYHFVQYTIPIAMVVIMTVLYRSFKIGWVRKLFAIVIICVSLGLGLRSAQTYTYALADYRSMQDIGPVYDWLNNNAQDPCVVFVLESGEKFTNYIPAYTNCDVYYSGFVFSGIPPERVAHNYLSKIRLSVVSAEEVEGYLDTHRSEIRYMFFHDWHQLFGTDDAQWIKDKIDELVSSYSIFARQNFKNELNRFRLDYILSREQLVPEIIKELNLREMLVSDPYYLYSF